MRELRSSTAAARDKGKASEDAVVKKASSRTKKAEMSSTKPKDEKTQTTAAKSWKTRGRIKATSPTSGTSSPEPEKEEKQELEDEPKDKIEESQAAVKQETKPEPEPVESKMAEPTANKENKAVEEKKEKEALKEVETIEGPEEIAEPTVAAPKSVKRKLTDVALEEEADEDSATEGMKSPTAASTSTKKNYKRGPGEKKKTQQGKGRLCYDKEVVEKAATAVIDGRMTAKKAAEEFGVSRSVVERRARAIRGGVPEYAKRRRGDPKVQVIRVEDLE